MTIGEDTMELTAVGSRAEIVALARKASQRPWLVVVGGNSNLGRMYRLEHRIVLGRSPDCDVEIQQDGASRRHAMLERTVEGTVQIVDLDSRNGTFVNGEPVSRATLRDGDRIQIGGTTILKFSYQDEFDEALQRSLYESATRDPLTRAVNRRGFDEALEREHAFACRHARPLSVVVLDIDHFKRVNDTYGHPTGDYALRRLAEIVMSSIRTEDVFARLGGEEFAILLRDIGRPGAADCGERLRASVAKAVFEVEGVRIPMTISVGVACSTTMRTKSTHALLETADRALYDAKRSGRNRVCVAASESGLRAVAGQ